MVVRAVSLTLDATDASITTVGALRYLSGLHLTADRAEFGGFSGLAVGADGGWLAAVSDHGWWLFAELLDGDDGVLRGLGSARLGPLADDDGRPVQGRARRDAEELVALPEGYLVTFEGDHRASLYGGSLAEPSPPQGIPGPLPYPREVSAQDENEGLEAAALLDDGRLLVIVEGRGPGAGDIPAWIGDPLGDPAAGWQPLSLAPTGTFRPTGAAALPSGDVLLLERSYSPEDGPKARLSILDRDRLAPGNRPVPRELARLEPPLVVDNMEAVAVRQGLGGEILIYLLSDDNFSARQRTLLLQFELVGE